MKYWGRHIIQSREKSMFLPTTSNVNAALNRVLKMDDFQNQEAHKKITRLELLHRLVRVWKCQSDTTKVELESPLQKK